ncbi:hypothetical protein VTL71DRAFT_6224 [Oculimacula yallundae]|uniref:Uncharacterized protein n=1 Tax=Oculimacula yallundae TaxID=86028 RepID=A0ABR4C0Q5_9HELO
MSESRQFSEIDFFMFERQKCFYHYKHKAFNAMYFDKVILVLGAAMGQIVLATMSTCKADNCLNTIKAYSSRARQDCSSYLEKTSAQKAVSLSTTSFATITCTSTTRLTVRKVSTRTSATTQQTISTIKVPTTRTVATATTQTSVDTTVMVIIPVTNTVTITPSMSTTTLTVTLTVTRRAEPSANSLDKRMTSKKAPFYASQCREGYYASACSCVGVSGQTKTIPATTTTMSFKATRTSTSIKTAWVTVTDTTVQVATSVSPVYITTVPVVEVTVTETETGYNTIFQSSTSTNIVTETSTPTSAAISAPIFRIRAKPTTDFQEIGGTFLVLSDSGANAAGTFTTSENAASQFRLALDPRAASMATSPGLGISAADDGYSGALVALQPSGTSPSSYQAAQIQDSQFPSVLFQPRAILTNAAFSSFMYDLACRRERAATGTISCVYRDKTNWATDTLISNPGGAYLRLVNDDNLAYTVKLELEAVEI